MENTEKMEFHTDSHKVTFTGEQKVSFLRYLNNEKRIFDLSNVNSITVEKETRMKYETRLLYFISLIFGPLLILSSIEGSIYLWAELNSLTYTPVTPEYKTWILIIYGLILFVSLPAGIVTLHDWLTSEKETIYITIVNSDETEVTVKSKRSMGIELEDEFLNRIYAE
jgi:hypothetical protein